MGAGGFKDGVNTTTQIVNVKIIIDFGRIRLPFISLLYSGCILHILF